MTHKSIHYTSFYQLSCSEFGIIHNYYKCTSTIHVYSLCTLSWTEANERTSILDTVQWNISPGTALLNVKGVSSSCTPSACTDIYNRKDKVNGRKSLSDHKTICYLLSSGCHSNIFIQQSLCEIKDLLQISTF